MSWVENRTLRRTPERKVLVPCPSVCLSLVHCLWISVILFNLTAPYSLKYIATKKSNKGNTASSDPAHTIAPLKYFFHGTGHLGSTQAVVPQPQEDTDFCGITDVLTLATSGSSLLFT